MTSRMAKDTVYIRPFKPDGKGSITLDQLKQWRSEHGALPDAYRSFLLSYNGGFVYPSHFPVNFPDEHAFYDEFDDVLVLDRLYDWETFVWGRDCKNLWNQADFEAIGDAIGGFILIRLTGEGAGSIHYWWRNNEGWDSGEANAEPLHLADSLTEFLFDVLKEGDELPSRWAHRGAFDGCQLMMRA